MNLYNVASLVVLPDISARRRLGAAPGLAQSRRSQGRRTRRVVDHPRAVGDPRFSMGSQTRSRGSSPWPCWCSRSASRSGSARCSACRWRSARCLRSPSVPLQFRARAAGYAVPMQDAFAGVLLAASVGMLFDPAKMSSRRRWSIGVVLFVVVVGKAVAAMLTLNLSDVLSAAAVAVGAALPVGEFVDLEAMTTATRLLSDTRSNTLVAACPIVSMASIHHLTGRAGCRRPCRRRRRGSALVRTVEPEQCILISFGP